MGAPVSCGVVYWGPTFRNFFFDFMVPTLLSPGNLPAVASTTEARILICTTDEDWEATRSHQGFEDLSRFANVIHIPFDPPRPGENKINAMSRGHRQLALAMHDSRSRGVWLPCDGLLSDGILSAAVAAADQGRRVIYSPCPRLANEGFIDAIRAKRETSPRKPLSLHPRELLSLALPHMHSETRRFEWKAPHFSLHCPSGVYWADKGARNILLNWIAWCPFLIDYSALSSHDTSTFDIHSLDADYVHRNFPDRTDAHVFADSDDGIMISFTPEAMLTYLPLQQQRLGRLPFLGDLLKTLTLRDYLHSPAVDPLARALFFEPNFLHTDPIHEWAAELQDDAAPVINALRVPLTKSERRVLRLLQVINAGVWNSAVFWFNYNFRRRK